MTATVTHTLVAVTPSDPAYEIQTQHWNAQHTITGLAAVASSGAYADLTGTPTLGTLAALNAASLTANVTGILPWANGGTNNNATPGAGQLIYSDASKYVADANLTWSATTGLLSRKGISSKGAANGIGTELFGLGASDAGTSATTNNSVFGANASIGQTYITESIVFGANAALNANFGILIGAGSSSTGGGDIVIGRALTNSAQFITMVAGASSGSNDALLVLGYSNGASHVDSGVTGWGMSSAAQCELSWGSRRTASEVPSLRLAGCTSTQYTGADLFRINTAWIDATNATRKARAILSTFDTAEREFMRADANGTGVDVNFNGASYTFNVPIKPKGYTVATLPAGVIGQHAYVTDALAPAFLAVIVGGGAVVTPVFHNGANWVSH